MSRRSVSRSSSDEGVDDIELGKAHQDTAVAITAEKAHVPMRHTPRGSLVADALVGDAYAWWHRSYVGDWVGVLVLAAVEGAIELGASPRNRFIPTRAPGEPNLEYSFPSKGSIVPAWLLGLISFLLTLAVLVTYHLIRRHVLKHSGGARFIQTLLITLVITSAIKYSVGRPRPKFYTDVNDDDNRLSFPSGHSSVSFASGTFLTLFLMARTHVFHPHRGELWRLLVAAWPMAVAGWISVSRLIDYHHDFSDVIVGAAIGMMTALVCYHLHYPFVFSSISICPKWRSSVKEDEHGDVDEYRDVHV